jgi:PAS domain S-box-containing protein
MDPKLQQILQGIPLAIGLHGREAENPGKFIWANECFCNFFGYGLSELQELKPIDLVVVAPDVKKVRQDILQNSVAIFEVMAIHKSGRQIPMEITTTLYDSETDISTFRDLTSEKKNLFLSEMLRKIAIDCSFAPSIEQAFDILLEQLLAIPELQACAIYVYEEKAQCLKLFAHRGLSDHFLENVKTYSKDSPQFQILFTKNIYHKPYWIMEGPGHELQEQENLKTIMIFPFFYENKLIGCLNLASRTVAEFPSELVEIFHRITSEFTLILANLRIKEDLHQSEERKFQLQQNLIQSSKMAVLGEMASAIAYEVNTPLALINGHITLLKTWVDNHTLQDDKLTDILKSLNASLQRLHHVISGLRGYSRNFLAGPAKLVPVGQILSDIKLLFSEKLTLLGIKSNMKCSCPDIFIKCRNVEIAQALANLVNNSIEAISELPEKWIELEAWISGDRINLSITDSGPGIALQVRDNIFQHFFTTKKLEKNMGLGLPITHTIIDQHHGHIILDTSSPHTRFVVDLPVASVT